MNLFFWNYNSLLALKFPYCLRFHRKKEKHPENCCCSVPCSFIRFGILCCAYWLESVTSSMCFGLVSTVAQIEIAHRRTETQWLCLQQYLPTQNTLTKSLILISMRGNKSQTLWRNEVHYSNSSLNVSPFFLWKRNGEIFSTDYNCVLLCCGDLL